MSSQKTLPMSRSIHQEAPPGRERLLVMYKAAKQCKVPDPAKGQAIKVYFNEYFERTFEKKRLSYVRKMLKPNRITMEEILAEPKRFVMVFRPNMVDVDFGGTCLPTRYSSIPIGKATWSTAVGGIPTMLDAAKANSSGPHERPHLRCDIVEFWNESTHARRRRCCRSIHSIPTSFSSCWIASRTLRTVRFTKFVEIIAAPMQPTLLRQSYHDSYVMDVRKAICLRLIHIKFQERDRKTAYSTGIAQSTK